MYNIAFGGVEAFTMEGLDDLAGKKKKGKKKGKSGWLKRYKERKKRRLKLFKSGGPLAKKYRQKKQQKKQKKLQKRSIAVNVGLFATKALATAALATKAKELARNVNFVVTTSQISATKVGTSTMYQATLYYVDKAAEALAEQEAEQETWDESEAEAAVGAQQDVALEAEAEGAEGESGLEVQMMMGDAEAAGEAKVSPKDLGMPTWGWVALGLGGLAVVGTVGYFAFGRKK